MTSSVSLGTVDTGILETHVQWDDILEAIQNRFHITATFGPNKKATNIGEGNGFLSRVALIEADWVGDRGKMPDKFIAKICSRLSMYMVADDEGTEEGLRQAHNSEVDFYNIYDKYCKKGSVCQIYGSEKFSEENQLKGYILMEYFDDLVPLQVTDKLTLDECRKVLQALAKLQATSLKFTDEEKDSLPKDIYSTFMIYSFAEETLSQAFSLLLSVSKPEFHDTINQMSSHVNDVVSMDKMKDFDNMANILNMKPIISHCDIWNMNLLFTKPHDSFEIKAIIDFQTCFMATPGSDLVQILICCLTVEDRRQHWKCLLSDYYNFLREEVEGEMPFTYEQVVECYLRFIPLGSYFVLPVLSNLLERLEKTLKCTEQEKEQFIYGICGLLEDALEELKREKKTFE